MPGLVFFLAHGPAPRILLAIGLVFGGWIVWAMRHSMGHKEIEAELATTADVVLEPVKAAA